MAFQANRWNNQPNAGEFSITGSEFRRGEIIGWLAIEAGTGTWDGHRYEAGKTSNRVIHNWYQINFSQNFSQVPRFIATLATYNDGDNAHLRYQRRSLNKDGVRVLVEEDTTQDSEIGHSTEVVHYLAIQG